MITRRQFLRTTLAGGATLFLPKVGIIRPNMAHAAFAEVGSGSQRNFIATTAVDSQALAFPGNVASGSLLVCLGTAYDGSGTPATITVTDTRSTSYSVLSSAPYSPQRQFIAYGIAPSGGACTVTVDPSGTTSYLSFGIDEFSGVDTGTPLDVDGGNTTGSNTTPTDSITTGVNDALILAVLGHQSSTQTITPGGSLTQIGENEDNTTLIVASACFRIATAAGSYSADWTTGALVDWNVHTASFRPAATAGGGARRTVIIQ